METETIESREALTERLQRRYKKLGFKPAPSEPPVLKAVGLHGVHWIGRAVVADDLSSKEFEQELLELSDRRMEDGGALCPLDLLPAADCRDRLRGMLATHGLDRRGHISVFTPVR